MPAASEEPLSYVLRTAGIRATQLHRWQDQGLMRRKPRRHGKGKTHGSETFYQSGTAAQAAVVKRCLQRHRSADAALWHLWWNGYWVSEPHVRGLLQRHLDVQEQARQRMVLVQKLENDEALDPTERRKGRRLQRELKALSTVRVPEKLGRHLRQRASSEEFPGVVVKMGAIATGTMPRSTSALSWQPLERALGVPINYNLMVAISDAIAPARAVDALSSLSPEELEQVRAELHALSNLVSALLQQLYPPDSAAGGDLRQALSRELPVADKVRFALVWIALRASPLSTAFASLLSATRQPSHPPEGGTQ